MNKREREVMGGLFVSGLLPCSTSPFGPSLPLRSPVHIIVVIRDYNFIFTVRIGRWIFLISLLHFLTSKPRRIPSHSYAFIEMRCKPNGGDTSLALWTNHVVLLPNWRLLNHVSN
ncbi:hypothetical protein PMAYCL1PPCAC_18373 [Pristionchus mayeri]|uniref:Uncharacterized protein n=1 Tax=Pristionchus mayeri TaxID=1317129 RepID=A0AAN5I1C7_9BILA|nr:hypothetical protein PMAYCL1PPCAC_18373 [Pristionchus mayeri]